MPAFQRMRLVRQNGLTNLVFHGTEHSRFSHSLGVAWTASQMLDAIERNSELTLDEADREDVILAALLHDIGHGPFSHTLEEILSEIGVKFDHEHMTKRIICESSTQAILDKSSPGRAVRLLAFIDKKERTTQNWCHSVVSSQLDADRLDYVRRDAAMAGVDNHRPDIPRLIQNLGVVEEQIVVDSRALDVVESFLLALDQMYEAVYFHKTVRGASALLTATLKRAATTIEQAIPDVNDPLRAIIVSGQDVPLEKYLRATDATVWVHLDRWRDSSDPTLKYLADKLACRSFPRALPYPSSIKNGEKLKDEAIRLSREKIPEIDPGYLVSIDEPERVSYKRYRPGEGSNQSIQVVGLDGQVEAIELIKRSIVEKVAQRNYVPRLLVPVEIREPLNKFAKKERIYS